MKNRTCAAFIFDGFSDHEVAITIGALNRIGDFSLETFSFNGRMVRSGAGLRVTPHASLCYMDPEDFDLLLLPGGRQWESGDNLEVFPLIKATEGNRPLVAIGAAALALADLGLLDDIPHTGHSPSYFLQYCPFYRGTAHFRSQPCVVAGSIITVNETALVPAVQEMLGLFDTLQKIYSTYHEVFDPACKGI